MNRIVFAARMDSLGRSEALIWIDREHFFRGMRAISGGTFMEFARAHVFKKYGDTRAARKAHQDHPLVVDLLDGKIDRVVGYRTTRDGVVKYCLPGKITEYDFWVRAWRRDMRKFIVMERENGESFEQFRQKCLDLAGDYITEKHKKEFETYRKLEMPDCSIDQSIG